ncbi:hypothetical protein ALP8811_00992 [Aliiroseovarius pelagivivens]|uniref:Aspartate racemase n=1 Tax=Aliiroseovarius pelagivivens TaxID=1639690 RepID=A0A2R8AIY2_9RHOB|nr:aspartate/glutamate racemase family protein [Aliiroseovarius pelagivivens]SPF75996.1 hypothetical protein ALP8811_00992 [Aliiroseovarius pelagivivens]
MHIGLIGGIGPAATIAYYNNLVFEFRKAGLPLELTIVHADVTTLISNAGSDNREAQAAVFVKHLRQLKAAGCDVAAITALTGHFCFNETLSQSPLPLLSAIEAIDRYCEDQGISIVGLLGSPPVLSSRLFGQLRNTNCVVPKSNPEELGRDYLEMATSGVCSELTRQKFLNAGADMVAEQKAEAILLAGTDLALAFDGQSPGYKTIDALAIHINALLSLARR